MKKRIAQSILAATAVMSISGAASALPDQHASSTALVRLQSSAASDVRLKGSQLIQDHDGKMIYVSPATRKEESGVFAATNSATENQCNILENIYKLTYSVPSSAEDTWRDVAKQGPYSPFFDLAFGNYIRYASLNDAILQAAVSEDTYKQLHKTEYEAYVLQKTLYDKAVGDLNKAKAELDLLDIDIKSAQDLLSIATTPDELANAHAALDAAIAKKAAELPEKKQTYKDAFRAEILLRSPYAQASAAWAPYQANLADMEKRLADVATVAASVRAMATDAFTFAKTTLDAFEGRTVGTAAAAYTIYSDEVSAAAGYLRSAGISDYAVAALPLFEVTNANMPGKTEISETSTKPIFGGSTGFNIGIQSVSKANPFFASAVMKPTTRPVFTAANGTPIRQLESAPVNQGSGSFSAPVTLGAYCSGSSLHAAETRVVTKADDGSDVVSFTRPLFTRRSTPVLAQAVSLDYKYYVQAEPVNVSCSLTLNSFADFTRSSGHVSGFFYSRSWDDTTRQQVKDSGLECHQVGAPIGSNPNQADQQAFMDTKMQQMQQEIMAEFILTYGKSWTISTEMPANPTPDLNHGVGNLGTSLLALCGTNPYCAVTGLVLKSLDEIFGHASGSTSTQDQLSGTISRKYSLSTWRVVPGSAAIDLTVRL